ncbi:MAG: leucine-rich repeat domain-containing protein [Paludibacteraceae bacterium]|nr:leucine-rich repeat domain-containing protein [Paludibacteraceae bacterium]
MLLAIISPTYAYDFQSGDLYYNITSNTTVEVASHYDHEDLVTAIIPKNVIYNNINYKVTNIGDQAFDNCSSLTSITIPNSVTSIGYAAFRNCYSLTSVTIPNSVTSIGWQAFYGCSSLNKTNYVGNIAEWCNIDFAATDANPICCSHNLYINNQEIKDLVIPNTVDSIQDYAFYECFSLKSVTIPNSVKSIGYFTFFRCCFLKKDFVNNSPLDAEENGYWGALVGEIEVDGMIIQGTTVVGCRKNVTIATIPNYITRIGSNAFAKCSSLTLVTISSRINSIESSAFDGCDALTKTNYTGDIAGWCAIKFGGLSANPISNSHNLYINNQEIRDLVIPNTVDSIHNYAFYECFSLTSVSIGNSVTSIGDYAFDGCSSLTSVTIGNSVMSIGKNAFFNCSSLTSINIPESVTNIWYGAFDNTGIYNDESNWENNVLYIDNCLIALKCYIEGEYTIKDGVRLIAGGTFWDQNNMTKVNFPNSVRSISALAFSTINITSLEIPNNVKNIEERAFRGCRYLSTITLGHGLTCIEDKVFQDCRALTSITIPNSITRVGVSSFENCSSLTSVTIGNGVTNIGKYAFYRCDRLSDIYCYATLPPSSQESSFPHFYAYVYVPCESVQHYRADNVWGKFQNLQCLDTEETDIENVKGSSQTLNNCNKLLRNGQLLILRDGVEYTIMGHEL